MLALGEGGSCTDSSYSKPMCPLSKKEARVGAFIFKLRHKAFCRLN